MKLGELAQVAMLGTERQPLPASKAGSALDDLLSQLDLNQREQALLSAAALLATHERIGSLPLKNVQALAEPAPEEMLREQNSRSASLLRRLLEGEFPQLLPECFALMTQTKQIALPELLPGLLGIGASKAEWREAILPVLGERGKWLAAQNADWSWVSGGTTDEGIWRTGEKPGRLLLLRQLRHSNAARAIQLLNATWKEESPDDRASFVSELRVGLNPTDEPFLETVLDDKRKEVRRVAAALLGRLPDSALVARMIQRARPLLQFCPGSTGSALKLKRAVKPSIEVTLPTECDKAMQRDGIEPKPQEGFGEKAWWLVQMLEIVPLSFWTTEWKTTVDEVLIASQAKEWKRELLEAWTRAAIFQKNSDWAEALFASRLGPEQPETIGGLLSAMSVAHREQRVIEVLTRKDKKAEEALEKILSQCRHEWSPEFSRAVLDYFRLQTSVESANWIFRNQLKDFAFYLAPSVLSEAARGWNTAAKAWDFWSKGVEDFLAIAQFRSDLHSAFNSQ